MALITFEQERWALSETERVSMSAQLGSEGIQWIPIRYHKRPPVLSTAYDILVGVQHCFRLGRQVGVRLFHGRGSVPCAVGYIASKLSAALFFNDSDGPLSEEYVDAGVWPRGSFAHGATAWAERHFLAAADAVAVLTDRRRAEVEPYARAPVAVLPCAVDSSHFVPDVTRSTHLRDELGLIGTVLVYSGKSGGWYRGETVIDFAAATAEVVGEVSLLVLTTDDPATVRGPAAQKGVRCVVRAVSRDEMPAYLSAGDAGLSFRLDTPSQRACSPIKNAEYLACGIPVVTTPGAGDYPELLRRERVGVVLEGTDARALRDGALGLRQLLADADLRSRCRTIAVERLGLEEVVLPRYEAIYERLLGRPRE
jgi:glycosyltransferase involved in cell wall biosynthesis